MPERSTSPACERHVVIVADHARINGGQAKVAVESALGLASRGWRVTYFAAVGPPDTRLAEAGISVICLHQHDIETAPSAYRLAAQLMWNRRAATALAQALHGRNPGDTVVHVHAWPQALSPSIGRPLRNAGLPVVYTMHEYFLACPNGGFYNYPESAPCTLRPGSWSCVRTNCDARSYGQKLARVARHGLLARSGLREAIGHIVMISELQERVARPYLSGSHTFHRVDNPIDSTDQGPKTRPGEGFLYAGRLSREKGIEVLLASAAVCGVTPRIVGDGPLREGLVARFPAAHLLGWRPPDQVAKLMRESLALVFPSVWYEGQPLTVYEALAAGTPVIVSDACAGREAVQHGVNGLWFRSGDPASLAEQMSRMSDPGEAARMTAAAHATYWAAPLTMDRHLDALDAVYQRALADGPAPQP